MGKIRLNLSLLGLEFADVQIPTPYGMAEVKLRAGQPPEIDIPAGVELVKA